MSHPKNLTGQKFGRLTAIQPIVVNGKRKWLCQCECGNQVAVITQNLTSGATRSCGCLKKDVKREEKTKHGHYNSRLYSIWTDMVQRTENSKNPSYRNYGARGIKICDEWRQDFQSFYLWSMSHGYSDDLSIDRIDVNKGYSPDNCKWANRAEQSRNKRSNRFITYNGKTMVMADWAKVAGIEESVMRHRLERGWSIEEALNVPPDKNQRISNLR